VKTLDSSLEFIRRIQREIFSLNGTVALLDWDQKTYMPTWGARERADQISLISRLIHEKTTCEKLFRHVEKLWGRLEELDNREQVIVKRLRRDVEKARKIPSDFVERLSKTVSIAFTVWEKAKRKNDFNRFVPHLERIIELEKEYSELIDLPGHPYNSLLDDYEEGMSVEKLKKAFSYLRSEIVDILARIRSSDVFRKQYILNGRFDVERQKKICEFLLHKMGISRKVSRLDVSTHPFTTSIGYNDVRITTNYKSSQPLFSFFSTMHEAGHALYELGLPKKEYGYTVVCDAASLGLHESQSRFWENIIARGKHFWKYFYPVFLKTFPWQLKKWDLQTWYLYVNQVRPSCIRIEADELTYPLHIILRFEIELGLIDGKIEARDLPCIWNEKMMDMLGIEPKNDAEGVLQDMHWSTGDFGYFPTYAIGNVYASQLFHQLLKEKPDVGNEIEQGNLQGIVKWLREHVYRYGRMMTAEEIIRRTCGEGLNAKVFVDYLKDKYLALYEV